MSGGIFTYRWEASHDPCASPARPARHRRRGGRRRAHWRRGGRARRDVVVRAADGGSITVKSSDGYAKTYQVTGSTNVNAKRAGIGSVKTGQTVFVLATASGSSATATRIMDFAALPKPPKMVIPKPGSHRLPRLGPCAMWHVSR